MKINTCGSFLTGTAVKKKKVMENNSHASLCVCSVSFSLDLALIVYVEEGVSLGFTVLSQHNSQI